MFTLKIMIKFLKNNEINKEKWNQAIDHSACPVFYARAQVLDIMCPQWAALVLGDYLAVMPLPIKHKLGILPYIFTPNFIQKLGVFAPPNTPIVLEDFLSAIPSYFLRIELRIHNMYTPSNASLEHIRERTSFILELKKPIQEIESGFNADAKKNLRKLNEITIRLEENYSIDKIMDLYILEYGTLNGIKKQEYENFAKVLESLQKNGKVWTVGLFEKNTLLGAGAFVVDYDTVHYVLGAPTKEGKKIGSTHKLIYVALEKFCLNQKVFDFEGSDIKPVAFFYKKFGSYPSKYFSYKRNKV
jgi:hypothetical protein